MKIYKRNDITKGLIKKGFEEESGDHIFLVFCYNGKPTVVWTKVSRGADDIPKGILSEMKKQLQLESQKEFEDLVDCKLSKEDYTLILSKKGLIGDSNSG